MTNPYECSAEVVARPKRAQGLRLFCAAVLLLSGPLCVLMAGGQTLLLNKQVMNKKDLAPFIGNETGTPYEYLFNVWHWDAIVFLLFLAAIPCSILGIYLLSNLVPKSNDG